MKQKLRMAKDITPKQTIFWHKQSNRYLRKMTYYKNLYHGMSWFAIVELFIIASLIYKIFI